MKNFRTIRKLCFNLTAFLSITITSNAQNWTTVGSGTSLYNRAMCVFNQQLFVGGDFVTANGNQSKRVAIWDNTNWIKADSGVTWTSTRCFCIYNNELYAGRDFGVSKWDGFKWVPVAGISSHVFDMTVYKNELYAIGSSIIQKWNGTTWSNIGQPNTDTYSSCVYNGDLIVAGAFTDINGVPFNHIAKWNGSSWSSVGIGILGGLVYKTRTYNGTLYVGGSFLSSQGNTGDYLTKWDGSNWSSAIPNISNVVTELDSTSGKLYLGGDFSSINGINTNNIAVWDGITCNSLGTGMNARISAIMEYKGSLYAGGEFTMASGTLNLYISRWQLLNGIQNYQLFNKNIKIFPNPFSTETIIESDYTFKNATLSIEDSFGRTIKSMKNIYGQKIILNRENLPSGLYYVRLSENNKLVTIAKLIVVD